VVSAAILASSSITPSSLRSQYSLAYIVGRTCPARAEEGIIKPRIDSEMLNSFMDNK
jgi:hypothetical protein